MTKEKIDRIIDMKKLIEISNEVQKVLRGCDLMEKILILEKLLMAYKYVEYKELKRAEVSAFTDVLKEKLKEEQVKKDL